MNFFFSRLGKQVVGFQKLKKSAMTQNEMFTILCCFYDILFVLLLKQKMLFGSFSNHAGEYDHQLVRSSSSTEKKIKEN